MFKYVGTVLIKMLALYPNPGSVSARIGIRFRICFILRCLIRIRKKKEYRQKTLL